MSLPSFDQIFTAANGIALLGLIAAFTIHELCHGLVAWSLGDDTGKQQGRLTLNPLVHIDPWMTVVLPFILLVGTGGMGWFGGARPMPVQPENFKKPRRDMALVAAAGPLSNWFLALLAVTLMMLLVRFGAMSPSGFGWSSFDRFLSLNLFLMALNLLPIPPLDGYKILRVFLPRRVAQSLDRLETVGIILVLLLLMLPATRSWWPWVTKSLKSSVSWMTYVVNPG